MLVIQEFAAFFVFVIVNDQHLWYRDSIRDYQEGYDVCLFISMGFFLCADLDSISDLFRGSVLLSKSGRFACQVKVAQMGLSGYCPYDPGRLDIWC